MSRHAREPFIFSDRGRHVAHAVSVVGVLVLAAGLVLSPTRAFTSLLVDAFFYLTIALGAVVFLALTHLSKAAFSAPVKRIPEAMAAYLPLGAVTMLPLIAGVHFLYEWSHPDVVAAHETLQAKAPYLQTTGFAARMVALLAAWILLAWLLRRSSVRQDTDRDVAHTRRATALSAVFLIVFGISFTVASVDWLMSLSPHWQSTIFGWYNVAGLLSGSTAAITMLVVMLRRRGLLPHVREGHLHDLGKLTFGFSTLWAYMWLSQYLLIWYANLPEETGYYLARTSNGWSLLFYANLLLGWAVPFIALLSRRAKRSEGALFAACATLLAGRWLDIYLMATPSSQEVHLGIGVLDVALFLGIGAAFLLTVERALRAAPLLPVGDPYLEEGLHQQS